jgi:hypothetical protein
MIANDQELRTTLDRIAWFQQQVAYLCGTETNPMNYRAAASGFLAEIDRMQLEVARLPVFPSERERRSARAGGDGRIRSHRGHGVTQALLAAVHGASGSMAAKAIRRRLTSVAAEEREIGDPQLAGRRWDRWQRSLSSWVES